MAEDSGFTRETTGTESYINTRGRTKRSPRHDGRFRASRERWQASDTKEQRRGNYNRAKRMRTTTKRGESSRMPTVWPWCCVQAERAARERKRVKNNEGLSRTLLR